VLRYAVLCGLLEGVLEGFLCGPMIDSSIVFCINGLGAVPTPRNTALFQSQSRGAGVYRHQGRRYFLVGGTLSNACEMSQNCRCFCWVFCCEWTCRYCEGKQALCWGSEPGSKSLLGIEIPEIITADRNTTDLRPKQGQTCHKETGL
jgi:hypothetical protein